MIRKVKKQPLVIGLIILLFSYSIIIFNSFFEEKIEYLYEPDSRNIYLIVCNLSPNKFEKIKYLNPFNSRKSTTISNIELLGTIDDVEKMERLLNDDKVGYAERVLQDIQQMISDLDNIVLFDVKYSAIKYSDVHLLIPEQLYFLRNYLGGDLPDVFPAKAVFIKSSRYEKMEVDIKSEVVIIRGEAARKMKEFTSAL